MSNAIYNWVQKTKAKILSNTKSEAKYGELAAAE
jgi:hypothetical protein